MLLEDLGHAYKVQTVKSPQREQREPWFLDINPPTAASPALTDSSAHSQPIRVFESGRKRSRAAHGLEDECHV